jgi:protocatechuate 3,4-dioxygenase beta subunit
MKDLAMSSIPTPSRRLLLAGLTSLVGAAPARALSGDACAPFVSTDEGPFKPLDDVPARSNLTARAGGRAAGQALYVFGQANDADCAPVEGVEVVIWQADDNGAYDHPRAQNDTPLDPHFAYCGKTVSDGDGFYLFKTIAPKPYTFMGLNRAAHIHYAITPPGGATRTTELYFAGAVDEARREGDRVWLSRDPATRANLIRPRETPSRYDDLGVAFEDGALCCRFDLQV